MLQTDLAPWVSVPMTPCLADRLWWLSHCKYWSVSVGLWHTPYAYRIVCLSINQDIKKRHSPILPDYLQLWNLYLDLYCWYDPRKVACGFVVEWPKCHPQTYTSTWRGVCNADMSTSPSKCPMYGLATMGLTWSLHSCTFHLFITLVLKEQSRYYADITPKVQ